MMNNFNNSLKNGKILKINYVSKFKQSRIMHAYYSLEY